MLWITPWVGPRNERFHSRVHFLEGEDERKRNDDERRRREVVRRRAVGPREGGEFGGVADVDDIIVVGLLLVEEAVRKRLGVVVVDDDDKSIGGLLFVSVRVIASLLMNVLECGALQFHITKWSYSWALLRRCGCEGTSGGVGRRWRRSSAMMAKVITGFFVRR